MRSLIVVGHPHPERSQTQSFFRETAARVPDAQWHELKEPTDIVREQQLIQNADRIILQFPLYWYSAPATLWQWLTDVWQRGVVYDAQGGLLRGKTLGIVVSFSHPLTNYHIGGRENVTLDQLLAPFAALAHKTGMTLLPPLLVPEFDRMTAQARAKLFTDYQQYLMLARPASHREQADWFAQRVEQAGASLLAETLWDEQDEVAQLRQTVAELRTGEVD